MTPEKVNKSRRRFIALGAVAGAGLALGGYVALGGEKVKEKDGLWPDKKGAFAPHAWLMIDLTGLVTVRVNHTEMGQGITTAYAMVVAEELDADWSLVKAEIAPAESVYKNPEYNTQMTAGSTSLRTGWDILLRAGAAARLMLLGAAAKKWGVPPDSCRTDMGRVIHPDGKRSLPYGKLAAAASRLPVPQNPRLKPASDYRIIGTNPPRLDGKDKAEGKAMFGLDVRLPGLLRAAMVHAPVIGAKPVRINSAGALKLNGVKKVLRLGHAVAVVAETSWQALHGAEALEVAWDKKGDPALDSKALRKRWAALADKPGKNVYVKGGQAKEPAGKTIRADYFVPYQAHATPEPMNCTARIQNGVCEVWAPTQHQDAAQEIAAKISGLAYQKVKMHTTFAGGGFGRRIEVDYVAEAVSLAKLLGKPVQVVWSREEDLKNDCFRPATHNRMEAVLNEKGLPESWSHRIVGADHMARMLPKLIPSMLPYFLPRALRNLASTGADYFLPDLIAGKKAIEGAAPLPYAIPQVKVEFTNDDPGIPTGFWRSVAHSQNAFVVESFVDELAFAAGRDPVVFRLELLRHNPALAKVLKLAAENSGWGTPLAAGHHRGVAAHDFHHTLLAFVAEISISPHGNVRVHKVVCALDCGLAVNPANIAAQMESGMVFGLTATLKSAVTLKKGRVEQTNFDSFPILTMEEMPAMETHILPSTRPPSGVGESAVPMIAPAVCNAVFAATGVRIRELPINPALLAGKRAGN